MTRDLTPQMMDTDSGLAEKSLRPGDLGEYVGQTQVKENLTLFIEAARIRADSLDHVLLAGPPGLGKTTLAHIIAREMGTQIHTVTGPNVEKKADLAAVLNNLSPGDVLFIDEIHRLQKQIEEVLYSAMEDYKLDIILGQGPAARTLRIDLPKFTLVGATTRTGLLSSPLRDRFGVHLRLEFYPVAELEVIVMRSARLLGAQIEPNGANEIARRARGTPRIANRLLRRVRDYAEVKVGKNALVDRTLARAALAFFEVDERGLDLMDRKFLRAIIEKYEVLLALRLSSFLGRSDTPRRIRTLPDSRVHQKPQGRIATNCL